MRIVITLLVLCVISCKSKPDVLEEAGYKLKIAYNVLYDSEADNYEVFSMDLDGSNKENLTKAKGVEWTYYAYDDKLYFVSDKDTAHRNYQLFKMKADGSNLERISDLRLTDSWHSSRHDGTEFIVNPHKSVDSAFYIIDAKGNLLKKIRPDLKYFSDPAFSPDGSQIVFRGALKSSKREAGFVDELYIINSDGSGLKQLTHYPVNDTTAEWYSYRAGPPKWHPNENYISYGSFQDGKYSLFAITPDGSRQWRLIENKSSSSVFHDWSPNGNWLVYDISYEIEDSPYNIELMNWETKETKVLTDSTYKFNQGPVFVKVYD